MRIIDAQIHLWAGGWAPSHHWRAPYTVETALRDMDEAGVDRAVNCPAIWDAAANDYAVEAAVRHPDRFATLGWFPLDASADESLVDTWLAKPGMLGLRFVLMEPGIGDRLASGALDWLWDAAHQRDMPVGLMVLPEHLPLIGDIAARHPRMRVLMDHLAISPFDTQQDASARIDALLTLARRPNIAVKATAVPALATDDYPFAGTHELLRRVYDAYGAHRMFWGTDITRLRCTWAQCVRMFTEELPWLRGHDLELVMGGGLADWIDWPR
ncbi:amidohydrolase family protein [Herbidospora sp. NBRC 101105]|uniref:amidohydrolase family protein n=1 Tax=Herbidospora sp. NBRC 101105 TaxID=3032195 RepID=UPI0024A47CFE|nr:amidohydrolase family protein [Herbidospora sp. NBRC 101105]GLX97164.1 amidohydrolase [Herbidospora sp. NBRC 101105]